MPRKKTAAVKITRGKPKPRGKPFQKGQSGNPAGRPVGAQGRAAVLVRQKLEAHADEIVASLVARATATVEKDGVVKHIGSTDAIATALAILCPAPKRAPVEPYALPPLTDLKSCTDAARKLALDTAAGIVESDHAAEIGRRIEAVAKLIDSAEIERRLEAIEKRLTASGGMNGSANHVTN
jgi:hypothetical protein